MITYAVISISLDEGMKNLQQPYQVVESLGLTPFMSVFSFQVHSILVVKFVEILYIVRILRDLERRQQVLVGLNKR